MTKEKMKKCIWCSDNEADFDAEVFLNKDNTIKFMVCSDCVTRIKRRLKNRAYGYC